MTDPAPAADIVAAWPRRYGKATIVEARAEAIRRLVDLDHLHPADARAHVDGQLADLFTEAAAPAVEAFPVIMAQITDAWHGIVDAFRDAAPHLGIDLDQPDDPIARARARRGTGPALPRLDGRRAS